MLSNLSHCIFSNSSVPIFFVALKSYTTKYRIYCILTATAENITDDKKEKLFSVLTSVCVHKASTFDSPKKEKRLPRKWRTKNYNKDVKTTLQVINVTIKCDSPFLERVIPGSAPPAVL